jgi:hypothetical protein
LKDDSLSVGAPGRRAYEMKHLVEQFRRTA